MNPATISAAIASSELNHAALVSRAASLSCSPGESEAWNDAADAHRITNNLRALLATAEQRNHE